MQNGAYELSRQVFACLLSVWTFAFESDRAGFYSQPMSPRTTVKGNVSATKEHKTEAHTLQFGTLLSVNGGVAQRHAHLVTQ